MTTPALTTNGLQVPTGFPAVSYEAVHRTIVATNANHPLYQHYAGAWNALAYRFRASLDHGEGFILSLEKHGSSPMPEARYAQEKLLFDFFSACFSCFESTFYALYTIGAFISPSEFNLATPRDQQQVSPNRTRDAFVRAFPSDPILVAIQRLFDNPEYQKLRETRNVLTHRTAPGRTMYVSIGSEDLPLTEWKLNNSPLDSSIITSSTHALAELLDEFIRAVEIFLNTKLNKK